MTTEDSGFAEDLLGSDAFLAVGATLPNEVPVDVDGVDSGALGETRSRSGGRPIDSQGVAAESAGSFVDPAGDKPLNAVFVGGAGGNDGHGAGILDAAGVDTVDGVDTRDAVPVLEGISGERTGAESESHANGGGDGTGAATEQHGFILPRWAKAAVGALVLIIASAMAFAIFQPITVLPRIRLAPGFGVTDQAGELFTSENTRGSVTLYTFSTLACDERCEESAETFRSVSERIVDDPNLEDVDVRLVTIVLDSDPTAAELQAAADASGADGETWRWVGGSQVQIDNLVGVGFKRFVDEEPDGSISYDGGYVIVDGWGVVRGDYKYQTLSDDGDKLARHLGLLGAEIRYASGAAAFAYEAAHVFLCYP